jgi:hypothetical protein
VLRTDKRGTFHGTLGPGHRSPAIFFDQIAPLVALGLFQRGQLRGCIRAILEAINTIRRCQLCIGARSCIRCHSCCSSAGYPTTPGKADHHGSNDASRAGPEPNSLGWLVVLPASPMARYSPFSSPGRPCQTRNACLRVIPDHAFAHTRKRRNLPIRRSTLLRRERDLDVPRFGREVRSRISRPHMALSWASPTEPIERRTPASWQRRPNSIELYCTCCGIRPAILWPTKAPARVDPSVRSSGTPTSATIRTAPRSRQGGWQPCGCG